MPTRRLHHVSNLIFQISDFSPICRDAIMQNKPNLRTTNHQLRTTLYKTNPIYACFQLGISNFGFVSDFDIRISDFNPPAPPITRNKPNLPPHRRTTTQNAQNKPNLPTAASLPCWPKVSPDLSGNPIPLPLRHSLFLRSTFDIRCSAPPAPPPWSCRQIQAENVDFPLFIPGLMPSCTCSISSHVITSNPVPLPAKYTRWRSGVSRWFSFM